VLCAPPHLGCVDRRASTVEHTLPRSHWLSAVAELTRQPALSSTEPTKHRPLVSRLPIRFGAFCVHHGVRRLLAPPSRSRPAQQRINEERSHMAHLGLCGSDRSPSPAPRSQSGFRVSLRDSLSTPIPFVSSRALARFNLRVSCCERNLRRVCCCRRQDKDTPSSCCKVTRESSQTSSERWRHVG
jgi:hypothetical protein